MKTQKFIEARVLALVLLAAALMSFGWYSFRKENMELKAKENSSIATPDDQKQSKAVTYADWQHQDNPTAVEEPTAGEQQKEPQIVSADTVPPPPPPPLPDWDEAFTEKFKAQFEDFYRENQQKIEQLMAEVQEEHMRKSALMREKALKNKEQQIQLEKELRAMKLQEQREIQLYKKRLQNELEKEQVKRQLEQERLEMQLQMEMQAMELKLAREQQELEKAMKAFQAELTEELVKDGYLKKGENIEELSFQPDNYRVNGKKIDKKDAIKYEKLYEKHFAKKPDGFRVVN